MRILPPLLLLLLLLQVLLSSSLYLLAAGAGTSYYSLVWILVAAASCAVTGCRCAAAVATGSGLQRCCWGSGQVLVCGCEYQSCAALRHISYIAL